MKLRKGRLFTLAVIAGIVYLVSKELEKRELEDAINEFVPPDEIQGYPEDKSNLYDADHVNIKTAKLDV